MRIYNTASRKKEDFRPLVEGKVNMYVCGPTTYNYIHIGNARPMVVFDAFRRYLESTGLAVNFIQNYTDVDDKIINRAKEESMDPLALASKYIGEYRTDAEALRVGIASHHPKVSENIPEIIDFVEGLIAKGLAYPVDGDVYFDVQHYEPYGKLSGRNIEDMRAGARVDVGEKKKNPLDFALWKSAKPGEISWDSPWGKGRPGWHIECSTMSMKYTGSPTLDIHGGGQDLIFPHHENEVAQSEGFTGQPFVNYWMHNGFITVNKEKMSKSLGNFFLVRDILEKFGGEVVRYFILSTHYRNPIDFNDGALEESEKSLGKLMQTHLVLEKILSDGQEGTGADLLGEAALELESKVDKALQDDFNTALAFSYFFDGGKIIGKALKEGRFSLAGARKMQMAYIKYLEDILGVLPFKGKILDESSDGKEDGLAEQVLEILLAVRSKARKEKNFSYSDLIRDLLGDVGIEILDSKEGSSWKKK